VLSQRNTRSSLLFVLFVLFVLFGGLSAFGCRSPDEGVITAIT
jgi:hypothetical protein